MIDLLTALARLQARIDERSRERRLLWTYGSTRRLAEPQRMRLWQLDNEIEQLYAEKRHLLTGLGSLCWEDVATDPAGWLYWLLRPQARPPDPSLRQPWRQTMLSLGEPHQKEQSDASAACVGA